MPTLDPPQRFRDMVESIDLITEFTRGLTREEFEQDIKVRLATERCLQIITEAATKLGSIAEELAPEIPWNDIRSMGNELRYGYDSLNKKTIWKTIRHDMAPLRAACETAIRQLSDGKG